jgi:NIPSNAP
MEDVMTEYQRLQELAAETMFSPVVELRQYTLHPGKRDALIDVFDRNLVESQEATGMKIIGQFRDLDRPDCFGWMRGFDDMEARRQSLEAFYSGPVWAKHKNAANATMIDSDDVLLLRPAWPGSAFDLSGSARGAQDASTEAASPERSAVLAGIYHVNASAEAEFVAVFQREVVPLLARLGAPLIAAFVTEHAENTFPRLPVRAAENVVAAFFRFADLAALTRFQAALAASPEWQAVYEKLGGYFSKPPETHRLVPTARSLLA